jgi:hypothetical protein
MWVNFEHNLTWDKIFSGDQPHDFGIDMAGCLRRLYHIWPLQKLEVM